MKLKEAKSASMYNSLFKVNINSADQKDIIFDTVKRSISLGSLNASLNDVSTDLLKYYTGSVIGIKSIIPTEFVLVGDYLYLKISITVDHDLSNNDVNDLKLFLSTQLTNGWGARLSAESIDPENLYTLTFDVSKAQWLTADSDTDTSSTSNSGDNTNTNQLNNDNDNTGVDN